MPRATLFRELLQERRWDNWCIFATHLGRAAGDLALQERRPRAVGVSIARRTFDRWMIGELDYLPNLEIRAATEYLLGFSFDDLFGPPRDASTPASCEGEGCQSETGLSGGELVALQPRRASQRDTAMQAFNERPGG
ncbi:hypothetical protein [Streptomyces sp. NPDC059802]|uniref:hypothetical protein n=1 Tax=Streptomyces sp. NPDC059802 TaxID=3346952 RepID=UPI0036550489